MTWEDRLKQLIAPGENKFPYRVVQIKPNRKVDEEIYLLSGREEAIAANGSLFLALYDLAQRDRIDFEEWFAQWELGFPLFNQFREAENSNYPLSGEKQWRIFDKRPKYKDWTPAELKGKTDFRVIEYWPDRSVEGNSIPLPGTDQQIIDWIVQIHFEGGGSTQSRKSKGGNEPELKGRPLIRLYFAEDEQQSNSKSLRTGEITFRIVDKTEDPDPSIPLDKISKSDLRNYATKIRDLFSSNGGYVWDKGKIVVSYRSRYQGFEGWYLARTKSDGEALIRKLLAVTEQPFHSSRMSFSENASPSEAFPESPETILVLGESVQRSQRRPNVSVRFQRAEIELSLLPNPIPLVEGDRIVYDT